MDVAALLGQKHCALSFPVLTYSSQVTINSNYDVATEGIIMRPSRDETLADSVVKHTSMCGFSMHGRIFKKCTIAPYATKGSMISQTTGVTRFCIVRTNHLCVSGVKGTLSKDNISSNTIAAADERLTFEFTRENAPSTAQYARKVDNTVELYNPLKRVMKAFSDKANFRRHVDTHTGRKNKRCEKCNATFVSSGELFSHERVHSGYKPFRCKNCSKRFSQLTNLRVHKHIHTRTKPFRCKVCNLGFTTLANLENHQLSHYEMRKLKCSECHFRFRNVEMGIKHVMKAHGIGEKTSAKGYVIDVKDNDVVPLIPEDPD
eukprot:jgi/Bigna1/71186/fgenesh1_pg.14_\